MRTENETEAKPNGRNDAESKAEGKSDTLATAAAMAEIKKMPLLTFAEDDLVELGALIELGFPGTR